MKFGKTWDDFKEETTASTYIRTLKEGDTVVQFLAEPKQWVGYYEHFNPNPGGTSFPCTDQEDCPGCNSDNERMQSRSRKVALPALVDNKWVNVYKIPKKFAERLAKRGERWETLMDREYILTRTGKGLDTDYDVETGDKKQVDASKYDIPDIEDMLAQSWHQTWGNEDKPKDDSFSIEPKKEMKESELRATDPKVLKTLLRSEGYDMPLHVEGSYDSNDIVDWVLKQEKV